MVLILDILTWVIHDVNLKVDRIAKKKNPPEMNMLNKNAKNNKMTIKSP